MAQAHPSTDFALGRAALEQGRDAIALEHFVLAAEDASGGEQRVAALAFAAEINLGLGRPYEAIAWTDRLRAEAPRPDQADLLEAVARLRLGDGEAALALVERVRDPDTAHHGYRPSSRHLVRGEALRLVSRPRAALGELAAAIRADPTDPDVWRAIGELCQQPDVDPGPVVAALPSDRFAETVGQLVNAPAAGVDRILEALWAVTPGDPRALVLIAFLGNQLPLRRALEWSSRMRAAGQADECPLLGLAANPARSPAERVRAAAVAWASFDDERARGLLELATTALPDEELEDLLHQVAALAPGLLDSFLVAGAATRSRALLLAAFVLDVDPEKGLAIARHGLTLAGDAGPGVPRGRITALRAAAERAGDATLAAALRHAGQAASARSRSAIRAI